MAFADILLQLERPYWSPAHPNKYIETTRVTPDAVRRTGWGLTYPDDIGAFNLMWLVSGVGLPPEGGYKRFAPLSTAALAQSLFPLAPNYSLKDAAALVPLQRFADLVAAARSPHLAVIENALRLRV
jgi:hypothetical protein